VEQPPSLLRELAHELRDALSPVRSALDLMRMRGFEPQASQALSERVERGVAAALATLDAFVLAEQYAAGTVSLQCVPTDVRQLLARVREALAPAVAARCAFAATEGATAVSADAARSQLALMSMLENAARIAAADSPIAVQVASAQDRVSIEVHFALDPRGAEPAALLESHRAHGSSRTALPTARRILQLQQGDLLLQGTATERRWVAVFRVAASALAASAPVAPGGASAGRQPVQASARLQHVLLVDDSEEVRRAFREALTALGYRITEAGDAEAALRAVAEAVPEVALIDIHLPGMNGYQLARRLKAGPGRSPRLVMLSGMTLDDITQRESRAAGFDRCFDKAAGPRALHRLLCELAAEGAG
jgi:CheY-like chemotaxis protein